MGKGVDSTRTRFLKIFANLPDKIREEEIIAVVDNKPYTWNNAAIEVKNKTPAGEKVLKTLTDLKVL